jgi:hypothetical protein
MERSRHEELGPHEPLKFTPEDRRELGVSFGDYGVGDSMESLSETMELGTPWSLTISLRNSHAIPFVVTVVVVGTR